jgi:hypothetical protein
MCTATCTNTTATAHCQGSEFLDSTNNGANCDFCNWQLLTASDPGFGRIELPHAVTGSNLFKYAGKGAAAVSIVAASTA